jgi:hypothetical protein
MMTTVGTFSNAQRTHDAKHADWATGEHMIESALHHIHYTHHTWVMTEDHCWRTSVLVRHMELELAHL